MREWMFLECTECKNRNYRTQKDPKDTKKLELQKYRSSAADTRST